METGQIIRLAHILIRGSCFLVGAVYLYPVLYNAMRKANGYTMQRRNIQSAMFSLALVFVSVIGNQITRFNEPTSLGSTQFFWESGMTTAIVLLTYSGVKMFAFKPPKDE